MWDLELVKIMCSVNRAPMRIPVVLFIPIIFALSCPSYGETYGEVPLKIQPGFILKILAFNNSINSGGNISLYVMNAPEFAAEMKKGIGQKIGRSVLSAVDQGSELPSDKPSVIYIGNTANLDNILKYTRANKIMSITGIPRLVPKGVSLGVGVSSEKLSILVNIPSSLREGTDWNPAIFRISKLYKK